MLVTDYINILTISETHLDNTFYDLVVTIHGYYIFRKYRNSNGGGVAVYIQNHITVKLREDLMIKGLFGESIRSYYLMIAQQ